MAITSKRSGYPITAWDALTLMFIGLRLAGAIDWSWWVVLLPAWVSLALGIAEVVVARNGAAGR